jgi:endonuclease/exonuclease/phosphatase family metal-dependent hydrolase
MLALLGSGAGIARGAAVLGASVGGFPRLIIQSVNLGQLFGEIAVVGSHLALSGHSRQGQSMMVSIDAGNLLG